MQSIEYLQEDAATAAESGMWQRRSVLFAILLDAVFVVAQQRTAVSRISLSVSWQHSLQFVVL